MNNRSIQEADWFVDFQTTSAPAGEGREETVAATAPKATGWRHERQVEKFEFDRRDGAGRNCEPSRGAQRSDIIFVPLDLAADSFEAARVGINIARKTGGQVLLFHAVHLNVSPYGPANLSRLKAGLVQDARNKVEPLLRFARAVGVRASCVVEEGAAAKAILNGARQRAAGVIVLAARQRSRLARWFRRGIVEQVLQEATCPVMVLQPNGTQK